MLIAVSPAILMAKLTSKERKALPKSDFAIPSKRAYPIEDKSHARNALARSSGKPAAATVKRKVKAKYPKLGDKPRSN